MFWVRWERDLFSSTLFPGQTAMPRTARASAANLCFHVLNRGNNRARVFHKDGDFDAFVGLLAEAKLRIPMRILAYCVLPNHFHLALWPLGDGDLGRWMHWLLTAHVRRYQRHDHSTGHVRQGRFRSFRSRRTNTFWWFCGTSSGIRCGPVWWSEPRSGPGPAWERSLAAERSSARSGSATARTGLGGSGERADVRERRAGDPPMRSAERTVRYRPMGCQDRHHIGPGVRSSGAGQPSTDR